MAAVAASSDSGSDIMWTAADVRRRSRRVLLGLLESDIVALPDTLRQWAEYLPATVVTDRSVLRVVRGGTRWADTVRHCGWPATEYVSRRRSWSMDAVPLEALAWVSNKLSDCMDDIVTLSPELYRRLEQPVARLQQAASNTLGTDHKSIPERSDLLALGHSGYPWRTVAKIASLISRAERDLEFLACSLLEPDPDMESRLFHLATLGHMIAAIRLQGYAIAWKKPLGGSGDHPAVEARSPDGIKWDLWFESGKHRRFYGAPQSAYASAVASVVGAGLPLRPDIMLINHPHRALVIECKWSPDPSYVGRDGFHQASSYALDTLNGLAEEVWSFVVGPQEVVPVANIAAALREDMGIVLGSVSAESIDTVISRFLVGNPEVTP